MNSNVYVNKISLNNEVNQLQSGFLKEQLENLSGMTKMVAKKILNNDFINEAKKSINSNDVEYTRKTIKILLYTTTQKVMNKIGQKIAVILTIISGIPFIIAILIILAAGGNIIIPIVSLITLIILIWVVAYQICKQISRKSSEIIFKAIEEKIIQLAV